VEKGKEGNGKENLRGKYRKQPLDNRNLKFRLGGKKSKVDSLSP